MDKTVSAAEANRAFSRLLRGVREGDSYTVTSHGRPVARLVPLNADGSTKEEARRRLVERWRSQSPVDVGKWTRDELYDRDR